MTTRPGNYKRAKNQQESPFARLRITKTTCDRYGHVIYDGPVKSLPQTIQAFQKQIHPERSGLN
ncbi:MAG: hypothetical protein P1V20_15230 [Verrucomicrobiales bacterium]|nr:hypothetical protein [Verrucomicrobiales bacterium]